MESHHPTELGVVKRVRMEGVRVTFFVLTVAIEAISTMEILVSRLVMGDGHGVPSYGHHHGPHDYPGHQNLYGADGLYGIMAALRWKNVTLHSYPLYHAQLCWTMTFHPPSSLLLCGTCNM